MVRFLMDSMGAHEAARRARDVLPNFESKLLPDKRKFAVLMVCMGNICRSPTAEAVLRHKLAALDLSNLVEVDSAGTHAAWHANQPPDPRAIAHARLRGYDLTGLRARMLTPNDFERFDLILAMDDDNHAVLVEKCDAVHRAKLGRLTDHGGLKAREVPDPYYGPPGGFDRVLDLVEDACDGLVAHIASQVPRR